jgi:hypothetical protein
MLYTQCLRAKSATAAAAAEVWVFCSGAILPRAVLGKR